jgi:SnoaL-like protein
MEYGPTPSDPKPRQLLLASGRSLHRAEQNGFRPEGVASTRTQTREEAEVNNQDAGQVAEAAWRAFEAGDWEAAGNYLHEDFVQEWPQSGERIVGRDNAIAINQNFPGGLPAMKFRRTASGGDLAVLEIELEYSDGSRYLGVSVVEVRDGKVARETDYFAQAFQAPQWRAQWVERM